MKSVYRKFKDERFRLLDVGCGGDSAAKAKYWFPQVEYYGLDKEKNVFDPVSMDHFYNIDLPK